MTKKTWLILLALSYNSSIYASSSVIDSSITNDNNITNPYDERWSCQIIKNDSDSQNKQKYIWACTKKQSEAISTIFNNKTNKSNKKQIILSSLGWISDTSDTLNTCNTCNGYYYQYPFQSKNTPLSQSPSNVEFNKLSEDIKKHELHYQGNVEIIQPSRMLYADEATVTYDPETQKPSIITATGNVKLIQPDEMIIAEKGTANLYKHEAIIDNALYLFSVPSSWELNKQFKDKNFTGYAHGTSSKIIQKNKDFYILQNATYTTCPPTKNTWQISAKTIDLDKKASQGTAKHTVLRVLGAPVFYFPYFTFPLGKERKTGFLYPSLSYGSRNGTSVSLPYYLNLAPNYDDTITPMYYNKNGFMAYNQIRWLTKNSNIVNNIYYMPNDKTTNNQRYYGNIKINTNLTNKLSSDILYQTVSDKNYFADFNNSTPEDANKVILDRHVKLNYQSTKWHSSAIITNYKTINSELILENKPFDLLPELNVNYDSINRLYGFGFNIKNDFANFYKYYQQEHEGGMRTYSIPTLNWQTDRAEGFLNTSITGYARSYNDISLQTTSNIDQSNQSIIPQFQLIEGLNFIRDFNFNNTKYQQTLTPKIGYLYTPYRNQDRLPIFDGGIIGFSYNQLFAKRSFSGFDRIQNSNQLSYALSTSITHEGKPVLDIGAGQIMYFSTRKVGMSYNSTNIIQQLPESRYRFSDFADQITYHFNDQWLLTINNTYDFNQSELDSLSAAIQYNINPSHILNLEYTTNRLDYGTLSQQQIIEGSSPRRNSQIVPSFIWELTPSWHIIGKFNYSLNLHKAISSFAGISYDSCCWFTSFGFSRFLDNNNPNNPNQYSGRFNNSFMLQFELKGLGSLATNKLTDLGVSIPGYIPYESGFRQ